MNANLAGAIASSSKCQLSVRELSFSHTRTFASYLMGAAYYWRNELAEAERHLMSVLDDFEPNNPSYVSNAAFVLSCMCLGQDCKKESEQILSKVSDHFQANNYTTIMAIIRAFQVELAWRLGDIERARDISKKLVFDMRPPLWFFYVPQLTPIKLLLAEGTKESLNEARSRLVELDEHMGRINRKNVRIDVLALMALVCHQLGEEDAALKHLQSALDLAQPGGWIRNFVDLGAPMKKLLERLNQADPGHGYTQQVLDACRADASGKPASDWVAEKTSSPAGQAAAPILSNREIDILHLLAKDLSNKEIASRLFIAPETVKTHLQNIYRKLDAKGGRVAALQAARTLGLIALD
jgi:LuxR family maltose regulon positive regulatory protein